MLQISASTATSVYKFDGACPLIIPAWATTIHSQEQNCDTAYSNTFSFSPPKKNKLRTSLEKRRFAGVSTRGVKAALHRREEAVLVHPTGAVLLRGTWPCCTPLLPLALRNTLPFFVPLPAPLEGKAAPFSVAQYLGCSEQPPPRVVATRSNAQHSPPCDAAADAASWRRGCRLLAAPRAGRNLRSVRGRKSISLPSADAILFFKIGSPSSLRVWVPLGTSHHTSDPATLPPACGKQQLS